MNISDCIKGVFKHKAIVWMEIVLFVAFIFFGGESNVYAGFLIRSFTAEPTLVLFGESTTLTWQTSNVESCTLSANGGEAISVPIGAYPDVYTMESDPLTVDTVYVLTCMYIGSPFTEDEEVTVTVSAAPPSVSLSANPNVVVGGDSTILEWIVSAADMCVAESTNSTWVGEKDAASGTYTENVLNIIEDVTFGLTCSNSAGSTTDYAYVTLSTPPPPAVVNTFFASDNPITSGDTSFLYWDSDNASSCEIVGSGGELWTGQAVSGSFAVDPSDDRTYTIVCTGPGGDSGPAETSLIVYMQCEDGKDNDGDGDIDYLNDLGCASYSDNDESDDPAIPACNDGIDNDGDGWIDMIDPGCLDTSDMDENNIGNSTGMKSVNVGVTSTELGFYVNPAVVPYGGSTTVLWNPAGTYTECMGFLYRGEWEDINSSGGWHDVDTTGGSGFANNIISLETYEIGCYDGSDWVVEYVDVRLTQCSDGIDNDGDGRIDAPDDLGCNNLADDDETDTGPVRDDERPDLIDVDER